MTPSRGIASTGNPIAQPSRRASLKRDLGIRNDARSGPVLRADLHAVVPCVHFCTSDLRKIFSTAPAFPPHQFRRFHPGLTEQWASGGCGEDSPARRSSLAVHFPSSLVSVDPIGKAVADGSLLGASRDQLSFSLGEDFRMSIRSTYPCSKQFVC